MSKERPRPEHSFEFSEHEKLFGRVSHERFRTIFDDEGTRVHRIELSSNSYGEFLFVTTSHEKQGQQPTTFYGLGYHEYRERWIHDEWFWYHANTHPSGTVRVVSKEDAKEILEDRVEEVSAYLDKETQTRRGELFEMLADLTDEDGAISEMDDLGSLLDDLDI